MAACRLTAAPPARPGSVGGDGRPPAHVQGQARLRRDVGAGGRARAGGEPAGDEAPRRRFVVQEHHATRLHWDLRLERDGALVSFAVPNGLPAEPGDNRLAVHTEDHPLEYLDFHGEIPRGSYGAGTMTIWDRGTYEELKWEPRKIEVHLHGERVDARYALFPIDKDAGAEGLDDPPHGPAGGPDGGAHARKVAPDARPAGAAAPRRRPLGPRGQVGRRAGDLPLRAGAAAPLQPQPQRDHGAVPRAVAAEPGAQPPPRDPRRRGRRLRRPRDGRASARSSSACT